MQSCHHSLICCLLTDSDCQWCLHCLGSFIECLVEELRFIVADVNIALVLVEVVLEFAEAITGIDVTAVIDASHLLLQSVEMKQ